MNAFLLRGLLMDSECGQVRSILNYHVLRGALHHPVLATISHVLVLRRYRGSLLRLLSVIGCERASIGRQANVADFHLFLARCDAGQRLDHGRLGQLSLFQKFVPQILALYDLFTLDDLLLDAQTCDIPFEIHIVTSQYFIIFYPINTIYS